MGCAISIEENGGRVELVTVSMPSHPSAGRWFTWFLSWMNNELPKRQGIRCSSTGDRSVHPALVQPEGIRTPHEPLIPRV